MATNNNVQNVVFLRNGNLFQSNEEARNSMQTQLTEGNLADGSAILGRYSGESSTVKTVIGLVYSKGDVKTLTFFDVEGTSGDIDALRNEINKKLGSGITSANTATNQLEALSGNTFNPQTSNSGDTSVEGAKAYAKHYTDYIIEALDFDLNGEENKVVYSVGQADGKLSATSKNITEIKLSGYVEGTDADIAATDTLGQALGKLQAQINNMDLSVVSGNGEVITAISEEDGKVSASKTAIKDVKLTNYTKTSASGNIVSTDDVEDALSKIENNIAAVQAANTLSAANESVTVTTGDTGTTVAVKIRSGEKVITLDNTDGTGGIYTDLDLIKITSGLPETIKERYQLLASDDSQIGVNIDIPKDSHIVSITYITDSGDTHYQNLKYEYIDASGNTQTTYVDMSQLVLETEFASGVTVTNKIAHGVVDTDSEKNSGGTAFLTVGANGFKVDGIKQEIINRINELDSVVTGGTTAGTATSNHIQVIVGESDGKLTGVTVTETNIANASDLAELSGKTVTGISSSNNSIDATISNGAGNKTYDIQTDASKIKMSGFTAAESGFTAISESSSITQAFKAVETVIIENEEVTSSSLNDLNTRIIDEIGDRERIEGQTGTAYTPSTSSAYISAATSLSDADVKLNNALKNVADTYIDTVKVNNATLAEANNAVNIVIQASNSAMTGNSNAIVVNTESNGDITIGLNIIDCGEY